MVFTKNATESLNILLKGFLKPCDHVLVSSMEHNAVMRPLVQLSRQSVSFTRIPCAQDGQLLPESLPAGRPPRESPGEIHFYSGRWILSGFVHGRAMLAPAGSCVFREIVSASILRQALSGAGGRR